MLEIEQGVEKTRRVARGEVGQLKISFTASALHTVLPEIIGLFRQLYPNVELNLTEICTEDQVLAL